MKILWFVNTPCGASNYLNNTTYKGGWLQSLEELIKHEKHIDLSVSFFAPEKLESFRFDHVDYFPVFKKRKNKFSKYIDRAFIKIESNEYLARFLEIVNAVKPDLIHIHGTELPFGAIIKEIQEIPVVISIQGNLTVYSKFFFRGISRIEVRKYRKIWKFLTANDFISKFKMMRKRASLEAQFLTGVKYVFGRTHWDEAISRMLAPNATYFKSQEVLREKFYNARWDPSNFSKKKNLDNLQQ